MSRKLTVKLNYFLCDVIVIFLCHFSILFSERVHGPVLTTTFGTAFEVGQVHACLQAEALLQIMTKAFYTLCLLDSFIVGFRGVVGT